MTLVCWISMCLFWCAGRTRSAVVWAWCAPRLAGLIFNDQVPPGSGLCGPGGSGTLAGPRDQRICGKKLLGKIISSCIAKHGFAVSANMLDGIKAQGYHYSTIGSLTVSIYDMTIPQIKYDMVAESRKDGG